MADAPLAVDAARDDGRRSGFPERLAEAVGVVAAIRDKAAIAGDLRLQKLRRLDVGGVARRERQRDRTAEKVADGVDFGGLPAARDPDGLRLRPPFPPCAERCAFT